jgi:hypothetical protein
MAKVTIGRISLHVSSMTPAAARQLAQSVAQVAARSAVASMPRVQIQLPHVAGETSAALEARIAANVTRSLRRS